ncbi:MAG: hypothetical protein OEZ22_08790 [Spirochaetia bacterium]|nr:hypothetical protein [Spirochaetia bacterium]
MKKSKLMIFAFFTVIFGCIFDMPEISKDVELKIRTSSISADSHTKNIFEKVLDLITGERLYAYHAENNVIITDFKMSFKGIEFEKYDEHIEKYITIKSSELTGPFQVDLLSETNLLTESLGIGFIEGGSYKNIKFIFDKSNLAEDYGLYKCSIFIAGTINGIEFIMRHDTSESMKVESEAGVIVDEYTDGLLIDINLEDILHDINLSAALDSNNDGLIDISPITHDNDINRILAETLKDNIKHRARLLKED